MSLLSSLATLNSGTMSRIGLCVVITVIITVTTIILKRYRHLNSVLANHESSKIILINRGICVPSKPGNPGIDFANTLKYKEIVDIKEGIL
jgi:hypothetical protein